MCCNEPPNHPGSVALIHKKNKGLTENQSESTVKVVKPVLNPVGFDYSKWHTNLDWQLVKPVFWKIESNYSEMAESLE